MTGVRLGVSRVDIWIRGAIASVVKRGVEFDHNDIRGCCGLFISCINCTVSMLRGLHTSSCGMRFPHVSEKEVSVSGCDKKLSSRTFRNLFLRYYSNSKAPKILLKVRE